MDSDQTMYDKLGTLDHWSATMCKLHMYNCDIGARTFVIWSITVTFHMTALWRSNLFQPPYWAHWWAHWTGTTVSITDMNVPIYFSKWKMFVPNFKYTQGCQPVLIRLQMSEGLSMNKWDMLVPRKQIHYFQTTLWTVLKTSEPF